MWLGRSLKTTVQGRKQGLFRCFWRFSKIIPLTSDFIGGEKIEKTLPWMLSTRSWWPPRRSCASPSSSTLWVPWMGSSLALRPRDSSSNRAYQRCSSGRYGKVKLLALLSQLIYPLLLTIQGTRWHRRWRKNGSNRVQHSMQTDKSEAQKRRGSQNASTNISGIAEAHRNTNQNADRGDESRRGIQTVLAASGERSRSASGRTSSDDGTNSAVSTSAIDAKWTNDDASTSHDEPTSSATTDSDDDSAATNATGNDDDATTADDCSAPADSAATSDGPDAVGYPDRRRHTHDSACDDAKCPGCCTTAEAAHARPSEQRFAARVARSSSTFCNCCWTAASCANSHASAKRTC